MPGANKKKPTGKKTAPEGTEDSEVPKNAPPKKAPGYIQRIRSTDVRRQLRTTTNIRAKPAVLPIVKAIKFHANSTARARKAGAAKLNNLVETLLCRDPSKLRKAQSKIKSDLEKDLERKVEENDDSSDGSDSCECSEYGGSTDGNSSCDCCDVSSSSPTYSSSGTSAFTDSEEDPEPSRRRSRSYKGLANARAGQPRR